MTTRAKLAPLCLLLIVICGVSISNRACAAETTAKVLIIAGPSKHPPGTHEVDAGARLMKHCLEHPANTQAIEVDLRSTWPDDAKSLKGVSSIVFIGDVFPPEQMENPDKIKSQVARMMKSGCGIVCVHYATGLRKQHVTETGDHPLLKWLGGYFATGCPHHRSVARVLTATIVPEDIDHPVLNGCEEFTFDDEPYWNNYFGKDGLTGNVTSLAYSMLPPDQPKKETVVWAIERPDGGRGVGIVLPHYFRNWRIDDLRAMVINGIYWSAKLEIPENGVATTLPDLATFKPESVDPQPRKKK